MRTSPTFSLVLCIAAALPAAACMEPIQSGGVSIIGDPTSRIDALCRFRHGSNEGFCANEPAARPPARVARMTSAGEGLKGPFATGRAGDYLLENDEIAVVIDDPTAGSGFAESGGQIVDAGDAKTRVDALGQVLTTLGAPEKQILYTESSMAFDPVKGMAMVQVTGTALHDPKLRAVTNYFLSPGSRAVVIETTLVRDAAGDMTNVDLGDTVRWGGAANGVGGKETGFRGAAMTPYLLGTADGVGYALVGDGTPFAAKSGASWATTVLSHVDSQPSSKPLAVSRMLLVAPRGDTGAIANELFFAAGGAPGGVEIGLSWDGEAFLKPSENRLSLRRTCATCVGAAADPIALPASMWLAPVAPRAFGAELPPGRYAAKLEGPGGSSDEISFDVAAGKVTKVALPVTPGGSLRARLIEAEPAALETARAEWAKAGSRAAAASVLQGKASPGKIQVLDAASGAPVVAPVAVTGDHVDIALPAGRYRVVASRGPELTIDEAVVEIARGRETAIELGLARVVDTRGYVGCDLHAHTARSLDSPVTLEKRLAASVAEGVECVVEAERNVVADPRPAVSALGLGAHVAAFGGVELASDASAQPFGHLVVLPLDAAAQAPRGGAPRVRDRSLREVLDEIRAGGDRVVGVAHPRSGGRGLLELLRFNDATGAGDAPGYDGRFDTIEVWSGRPAAERDRALEDLWALLRASHPATPTASAFVHGRPGDEPGYPRTYVAVADDDPQKLAASDLVSGLAKRRDVVLTNGPFVTVRASGAGESTGPGSLVTLDPKKRTELTVRVERAPWVDATELTLFVGGVAAATVPLSGAQKTARGALMDEQVFTLARGKAPSRQAASGRPAPIVVTEDTFVVAVVHGVRPLAPVLSGDAAELAPFAMTSPIWLDADGDGRSLGR
jgi:hypothetical protein